MKGPKLSTESRISGVADGQTGLTDDLRQNRAIYGLALAGVLSGCAANNEAQEGLLKAEINSLQQTLDYCQERSVEGNGAPVIIGYGTFGVTLFRPGVPNDLVVPKAFQGEMELTMLIWPPAVSETDIKMEGNPSHLRLEKIGNNWAVVFKSDLAADKESVVIDVNRQRYVLLIKKR